MGYITFDKKQLINLEFSLSREILRANYSGSYSSFSIIGCNTRKYHGLLVSLQPQIDHHHHVFLSSLDVTIIQQNEEFNLGIHKYAGNQYEPGGHKYAREFFIDPVPKIVYRVGGVVLSCEMVLTDEEDRILIRYTLLNATSPTKLRFRPLTVFRSVHALSKFNNEANTGYSPVKNGIMVKMYEPYEPLFLQFSKKPDYQHQPDWYYHVEYTKEKTRGYEYQEDLLTPGYFELGLKKGDSVLFSAGLTEAGVERMNTLFNRNLKSRIPRDNFINCLRNSARQFFIRREGKIQMIAGYHWFNVHGRDTFIALPGLTLTEGNHERFLGSVDTMTEMMQDVFFPNDRIGSQFVYNSVDTPLWFFWSLQQFTIFTGDYDTIWNKYRNIMEQILTRFEKGTSFNIFMQDNGLLWAGDENDTLTWMNSRIDGKPVIDRHGLAVEVNVLWYNAIRFFAEILHKKGKKKKAEYWEIIAGKIEFSFTDTFWDAESGYLADVVRGDFKDMTLRPNQLFVASMPYSPVTDEIKYLVLHHVQQELLTPRGIRTLTPKSPEYMGSYGGDIICRDVAYHQGTAFPWLLGHFAEGFLKIHGRSGLSLIKKLFKGFEEEVTEEGIGSISELYFGNPPYTGKGAISQAWSVAELLRIHHLLNQYDPNTHQSG
jgi:predicted glycogen debranching enzyme